MKRRTLHVLIAATVAASIGMCERVAGADLRADRQRQEIGLARLEALTAIHQAVKGELEYYREFERQVGAYVIEIHVMRITTTQERSE